MTKEEFNAARRALYDSYGGVKKRTFKDLSPRLQYDEERSSKKYESVIGNSKVELGKSTVMSPENLAKESPEVREEIIRKSKRLVPLYSKGPVQFMTDEADPHDAGKKK